MLKDWITAHPPDAVFLTGPHDRITYGDLAATPNRAPAGQVVVFPNVSATSVIDLMTVPSSGSQLVVIDPRLPAAEVERRLRSAEAAVDRRAATILFTSGTTGPAKAVRLTAENWTAAAQGSAAHLGHRPDDVWLAAMPFHHVGGLSILYRTAFVGASVRWLPRFDAGEFSRELRSGVTFASVVPTMLRRVLDHDDGDFSGLRAVLVGGGPIPVGLLEEAHARGIPALPTYGMTETCAQVATLMPGSPVRYAAHTLPEIEVRIGADGRIQVRGAQVSPGYANADDRPTGEWFITPDLGELDHDGALRVLGRADDMIVTGGENVSPGNVEAVLAAHPQVTAATVVGIDDPQWGQRVVAAYQGSVEADDLAAWARTRLSAAETPRTLRRVDTLPTIGLGKPDRVAIRALME